VPTGTHTATRRLPTTEIDSSSNGLPAAVAPASQMITNVVKMQEDRVCFKFMVFNCLQRNMGVCPGWGRNKW
jgi:hypothetical protein